MFRIKRKPDTRMRQFVLFLVTFFTLSVCFSTYFEKIKKNENVFFCGFSSAMEVLSFSSGCLKILPDHVYYMPGDDSICVFIQDLYQSKESQFLFLLSNVSNDQILEQNRYAEKIYLDSISLLKIPVENLPGIEIDHSEKNRSLFCLEKNFLSPCFLMRDPESMIEKEIDSYWHGLLFLAQRIDSLNSFFDCIVE